MDKELSLYELTKQLAALQHLRDKQQRSEKLQSKLELRDMIGECFKIFEDIAAISPTFCENAVEKEGIEESYLEIQRKNGLYLQDLKEKISQLFMQEETQANKIKIPDNLEECLDYLNTEVQKQKEQRKVYTCLLNNLDAIFKNFFNETDCIRDANGETINGDFS